MSATTVEHVRNETAEKRRAAAPSVREVRLIGRPPERLEGDRVSCSGRVYRVARTTAEGAERAYWHLVPSPG